MVTLNRPLYSVCIWIRLSCKEEGFFNLSKLPCWNIRDSFITQFLIGLNPPLILLKSASTDENLKFYTNVVDRKITGKQFNRVNKPSSICIILHNLLNFIQQYFISYQNSTNNCELPFMVIHRQSSRGSTHKTENNTWKLAPFLTNVIHPVSIEQKRIPNAALMATFSTIQR